MKPGRKKTGLKYVGDGLVECTKCKEHKTESNFIWNKKSSKYPYQVKYCKSCIYKQRLNTKCKTYESFLKYLFHKLRNRVKRTNTKCTITLNNLIKQYENQKGKCFYTDTDLTYKAGNIRTNISMDRVNPKYGYTKYNVVLCTRRINTIKSDLTLQEIQKWMPTWYKRIIKRKQKYLTYKGE